MKACRGIGASLTEKEILMWEQEHKILLEHIAPNEFDILHYGAIAELKNVKFQFVEMLALRNLEVETNYNENSYQKCKTRRISNHRKNHEAGSAIAY